MGGFLGIGQSGGQKSDRGFTLGAWNSLRNVFNYALPTSMSTQNRGAATTALGTNTLTGAGDYWQRLLSGSRTALEGAVAPERNMIESAADASRRQQSQMGTARGGGTAATNQTQQDQINAQIDQALLGVRPEAAKETAAIGATEAGVGLSTEQIANQLLGLSAGTQETVAGQSEQDYQARAQQQAQLFGDITSGLALGLGLAV